MLYLILFIVIIIVLTLIDMKDLKKSGQVRNIIIYVLIMTLAAGFYGWYRLSDDVSFFGSILDILGLKG